MKLVLKNDAVVANMLADRVAEKCGASAASIVIPHPSSTDTVVHLGEGVTPSDVKECAKSLVEDLMTLRTEISTKCAVDYYHYAKSDLISTTTFSASFSED